MINSLRQRASKAVALAFRGGGPTLAIQEAEMKVQTKPKGLYIMEEKTFDTVYGPEERKEIAGLLDLESEVLSREEIRQEPSVLADVEVIMASWGTPVMDAAFLKAAPHLRAVFYGAGSVRPFTTPAFWSRNITICSAYSVNAQPVAEFTLGVILLSLKNFWSFSRSVRAETDPWADHNRIVPGAYRSTVGLISCGMIARRLIRLMKSFEVDCIVYDPFLTPGEAIELGVELCSLAEVFQRSHVVSLHTPYLPETVGLVTGSLIESMRPGATLINTARGGLIRETEMIEALTKRTDITAILDVSDPEPPLPGNLLIQLPNVVMTPHIAGSVGPECRRLGRSMLQELKRYLAGERLQWQITQESVSRLA